MANDYVSRVNLEINGQNIDDFASVEEGEEEIGGMVKLMNKTGFHKKTVRQQVRVDYVVPADSPEFNFWQVQGGTLTIDYQNGVRKTYSGVNTMKIGQAKSDGEKETTKTIEFMATLKTVESSLL
jgi:hypothetical protein